MPDFSGTAVIEDGAIVVRLPIGNLATAVAGGCSLGVYAAPFRVDDAEEFAADVVNELCSEDEQGTTRVHRMFDAAFEAAVEQGAFGVVHQFQCEQCGLIGDETEQKSHDCDEVLKAEVENLKQNG